MNASADLEEELKVSTQRLLREFRRRPADASGLRHAKDGPAEQQPLLAKGGAWPIVLEEPDAREAMRSLQSRLIASCSEADHRVLAVSSALKGEGRTTVAVGLARLMAEDPDAKVLLMDANLQRPQHHRLFNLPATPGLAECFDRKELILKALHQNGNLWLLPAGEPTPLRLADLQATRRVIQALRCMFKYTIIDLPASLESAETSLMMPWADSLIWVVRPDVSPVREVARTLESVDREKLMGVVVNGRRPVLPAWLERLL